jgi:hypothetical protein
VPSHQGDVPVSSTSDVGPKEYRAFDHVDEGSSSELIVWSPLKSPQRALEKLLRCYGSDVSRLVDICRQKILFDGPEDLLACLKGLLADPEIRIVRIKNGLGVGEAPEGRLLLSGGFR